MHLCAYLSLQLCRLTAMMLKKSSSPRVSSMEETVCLAIVSLRPFMLPLTSTRITTSFGEVAAWMYHFRFRQSKAITPCSSGFHLIPLRITQIKQMNNEIQNTFVFTISRFTRLVLFLKKGCHILFYFN